MKIDEIMRWRQDVFDSTLALRSLLSPSLAGPHASLKLTIPAVANVPRRLATVTSMSSAVSPANLSSVGPSSAWTSQDRDALNASMAISPYNANEAQVRSAVPPALAPAAGMMPTILKRPVSVDMSAAGNENLLRALNSGGDFSAAAFPSPAKLKQTELTVRNGNDVDEGHAGMDEGAKMDYASVATSRQRVAL